MLSERILPTFGKKTVIKRKSSSTNYGSTYNNLRARFVTIAESFTTNRKISRENKDIRSVWANYEGRTLGISCQANGRISLWNCPSSKPDEEGKPIMVDGRRVLINLNIDPHPVVKLTLQPMVTANGSGSVSLHELNSWVSLEPFPVILSGGQPKMY